MKHIKIFLISLASSFAALAADIDVSSGQLEGILSDKDFKEEVLRLSGTLDARDLAALEHLNSEVKTLDLSEVKIVSLTMPNRRYFGRTLFSEGEIPAYTFFKSQLESLILPRDISLICEGAFSGSNIKEIVIPEGVTTIGDYAFYGCNNLKSVTLPSSLKTIGKGAFGNCTALESINLGTTGVTTLPERVFAGAVNLSEVVLPAGLSTVGRETFSHTAIKSLNLGGVAQFDAYALSSMPFLESLSINPDADITDGLLMDDISLVSLTGVPEFIPDYFAANCGSLDTQVALGNASSIGRYSFANNAATELILPGFLTSIERGALSGLTSLTRIDATALDSSIPSVDETTFEGLEQPDIELLVSDESFDAWKGHPVWGLFNVMSQEMTGVEGVAPDDATGVSIRLAGNMVVIESDATVNDVRVYTADGRIAFVASPGQPRVEIETASLPQGLVIVAAGDSEGNASTVSLLLK